MSSFPAVSRCRSGLSALAVLQATMLAAMYTGTPPHPPLQIPLFALGPFLGASLAVAIAAWVLVRDHRIAGPLSAILAAALALLSFGPQKWLDPAIGLIWPAVLLGQIASLTIILQAIAMIRGRLGANVETGAAR